MGRGGRRHILGKEGRCDECGQLLPAHLLNCRELEQPKIREERRQRRLRIAWRYRNKHGQR